MFLDFPSLALGRSSEATFLANFEKEAWGLEQLKMLMFLQDLNSQTEVCRVRLQCAYVHVQPVVDVTQALSK